MESETDKVEKYSFLADFLLGRQILFLEETFSIVHYNG